MLALQRACLAALWHVQPVPQFLHWRTAAGRLEAPTRSSGPSSILLACARFQGSESSYFPSLFSQCKSWLNLTLKPESLQTTLEVALKAQSCIGRCLLLGAKKQQHNMTVTKPYLSLFKLSIHVTNLGIQVIVNATTIDGILQQTV